MPLKRDQLERQLSFAEQDLADWEKRLKSDGNSGNAQSKDPRWRTLNATCRKLKSRIRAVAAVDKREDECRNRKAEKESGGGD